MMDPELDELPIVGIQAWDLISQFPLEILRSIIEASGAPLATYCCLIGLNHSLRFRLRGALQRLLVSKPIPPNSFAAIMEPCRQDLTEVLFTVDLTEFDNSDQWIDTAFAKHPRLRALHFFARDELIQPQHCDLSSATISRILYYLPDIQTLTFELNHFGPDLVLSAVARYCPHLRDLFLRAKSSPYHEELNVSLLVPCQDLRVLTLPTVPYEGLQTLIDELPHLEDLSIHGPATDCDLSGCGSLRRLSIAPSVRGDHILGSVARASCPLEVINLSAEPSVLCPVLLSHAATLVDVTLTGRVTPGVLAAISSMPCLRRFILRASFVGDIAIRSASLRMISIGSPASVEAAWRLREYCEQVVIAPCHPMMLSPHDVITP
ncbi:hypothetical protein PAPYR_2856 [Paratrimastix pyriformis]|uniref:F-box domain-containing protein n=1 Tax=Paratrimastix pyriformis TaxID=342808 RepID=A0ABQ8UW64_9EUKA|nr:hypothetical protein PAPYR_2856 [Paratrimastix pyriformis]